MSLRPAIGGGLTWLLRALSWGLLGGWFGSFSLFAFVIAPTAFQVLPSQAAAGALVSPVLGILHNYGTFAGISLALMGVLMGRGKLAVSIPIALAALCILSEYVVTPAIAELRPRSFGVDQEEEASRRFSDLHQLSRYLFGTIQLGALGLIALYARPETRAPTGDVSQSRT